MTTLIAFHEVEDGEIWAKAWQAGVGSRHELFAKIGVTVRTFRNPDSPDSTGLIFDVPDMEQFQTLMASDEVKKAQQEDGLKMETLRVLSEFTP